MSPQTITYLVLAATVAIFVWDRLPVAVLALGVPVALWATDVLELEQSLAGFGDPTVLFITSLFVVSEALDATGVTGWLGRQLVARAGRFLTPIATPANLMVMEPGGYRFGDYWKLGLPLEALFGAVAVLLVPVV